MLGPFYNDTLEPHIVTEAAQVTLSTTDKAMHTANFMSLIGPQFFNRPGRKLKISAFGKMTTAVTPGNLTISIYFGTGADANGTIIVASAAQTLIASQTNIPWELDLWIRCVTAGSSGTLFARGHAFVGTAMVAVGDFILPASAPAVSSAVDLTGSLIPSVQFKRSGSTAEVATIQDFEAIAMN